MTSPPPNPRVSLGDDLRPQEAAAEAEAIYGSGPFVVLVCRSELAEDLADLARAQCRARGVNVDVKPIDEFQNYMATHYTSMIVVLPGLQAESNLTGVVDRLASILQYFRRHRPHGIATLESAEGYWHQGVIQLIGTQDVLKHPSFSDIRQKACKAHDIGPQSPPPSRWTYFMSTTSPG